MKRFYKAALVFVLLACTLSSLSAKSKKSKYKEWWNSYGGGVDSGNVILDAGLGLNFDLGKGNQLTYYVPPIEGSVEYTVRIGSLPLGFGGFVGFTGFGQKVGDTYYGRNQTYFGALANYHFNFTKLIDFYAGALLGANVQTLNENGTETNPVKFRWGAHAGATWYINDVFGVNAEVGFPTMVRVAASLKLDF